MTQPTPRPPSEADPLAQVAAAPIIARIETALDLARRTLPDQLDRFESLLRDALDRTAAWQLARHLDHAIDTPRAPAKAEPPPQAHGASPAALPPVVLSPTVPPPLGTTLARTALAAGGEPRREFLLIPFGRVAVDRPLAGGDFAFTREHAHAAVAWFERIGRKLAIDYEHQSVDAGSARADGLRPAAGWVGALEVRGDGLWATGVSWTPRAELMIRSGEYRYFSPVIYWSDESYAELVGLGPIALTNDPAMCGVTPLAARRSVPTSEPGGRGDRGGRGDGGGRGPCRAADEDGLANSFDADAATAATSSAAATAPAGGATATATAPAGGATATAATAPATATVASATALRRAHARIAELERDLVEHRADAFIDRGARAGKIVASTAADWRNDYLADPDAAEQRLARTPALLPPGRVVPLDALGRPRPLSRSAAPGAEMLKRWGCSAADLEAFDRAVADGRVVASAISVAPVFGVAPAISR